MDFQTVLTYAVGIVETAALLGALIFGTAALKAKDNHEEKKAAKIKTAVCFCIYIVLNLLRTSGYGA